MAVIFDMATGRVIGDDRPERARDPGRRPDAGAAPRTACIETDEAPELPEAVRELYRRVLLRRRD